MFKMRLDTNLGGEIAFGLERVEVAAVAHKAIVCLSPKIRVGVRRYGEFGIRKICFCGLIEPPSVLKTLQLRHLIQLVS